MAYRLLEGVGGTGGISAYVLNGLFPAPTIPYVPPPPSGFRNFIVSEGVGAPASVGASLLGGLTPFAPAGPIIGGGQLSFIPQLELLMSISHAGGPAVPVTWRNDSLRGSETLNAPRSASFTIISLDGSFRPKRDDKILLALGNIVLFAGYLTNTHESGFEDTRTAPILTDCDATSNFALANRKVASFEPVTETVKQLLESVVFQFLSGPPFNVTYDSTTWDDGPTLVDYGADGRRVGDILTELVKFYTTPTFWDIDEGFVFRLLQQGEQNAPFALSPSNPNLHGDLRVTENRDFYANRIVLKYGRDAQWITEETQPGWGSGGVFTIRRYTVKHRVLSGLDTIIVTQPNVEDGTPRGFHVFPLGTPDVQWTFDTAANQLVQSPDQPYVPTDGTIMYSYQAAFPETLVLPPYPVGGAAETDPEILEHGPWETGLNAPDIFDHDTALLYATAYLSRSVVVPRHIDFGTLGHGVHPGQGLSVYEPRRDINEVGGTIFLVTELQWEEHEGLIQYTIAADEGTTQAGSWRDFFQNLGSGGGGGGTTLSGGGGFNPPQAGGSFRVPYPLGGSGFAGISNTDGLTWMKCASPVPCHLDSVVLGATTVMAVVMMRAHDSGVGVTARVTVNGLEVGRSTLVVSTTDTIVFFRIALQAGDHNYELELLPDTPNAEVFATGILETGR